MIGRKKKDLSANLVAFGLAGYMTGTLFYGFLKILGLVSPAIEEIRVFLPETFLIFIFLAYFFNTEKKITATTWFLLYVAFISVISYVTAPSERAILVTARDVLIPIVMLCSFSNIKLTHDGFKTVVKVIRVVFTLFIVVGFVFSLVQYIHGWQWVSRLFAGYEFWGIEESQSLRISNGWLGGVKVLGTTGSAENFGIYCPLALAFMMYYGYKYKWFNVFLCLLAIISTALSGSKTGLAVMVIAVMIKAVSLSRGELKRALYILTIVAAMLGTLWFIFFADEANASLLDRFRLWEDLLNPDYLINVLFPFNLFFFSSGAGNEGIIGFWDNAYFFSAFAIGAVGTIWLIYIIYKREKETRAANGNGFTLQIIIILGLSALSTCIFFGRSLLTMAIIFLGVWYADSKNYKKSRLQLGGDGL